MKNSLSLEYLNNVANWFDRWHSKNPSYGFSRETSRAAKHTTMGMIGLVKYLLTKDEIDFVLPGLVQSDFIEGRFGWYRQLNGGNYYASVLQFLKAEKTIRLSTAIKCPILMTYLMSWRLKNLKRSIGL